MPGMTVLPEHHARTAQTPALWHGGLRSIAREVEPVARRVGLAAPLFSSVKGLSVAEKWLINICRPSCERPGLSLWTADCFAVGDGGRERCYRIVEDLSRSGVAVLYVSPTVSTRFCAFCHPVTAFRDGRSVATLEGADLTRSALVEAIVGGAVENLQNP